MKISATIALASVVSVGLLSTAMAADVVRPVYIQPAAAAIVAPAHRLLHPILWCAGGAIISVVVHNPIPVIVGCSIGAVELVHNHAGY